MDAKVLETPNTKQVYYVTWRDLPLSCPTPGMRVWDSHPRIYLPIQESGHEQCPYCGAIYILKEGSVDATSPNANRIDVENAYHTQITRQRGLKPGDAAEEGIRMRTDYNQEHLDSALDEALKSTFPASDPVSISVCRTQPAGAAPRSSGSRDETRRHRRGQPSLTMGGSP